MANRIQEERIMSLQMHRNKHYFVIMLTIGGSRKNRNENRKIHHVHRLVLTAFKGIDKNPERNQVNHLNGNGFDNRPENLEWSTHSENQLHSFRVLGRKGCWNNKKGKHNYSAKKIIQIDPITMKKVCTFYGAAEINRKLGFNQSAIGTYCKGIRNKNTYKGFIWQYA